jgi:uncharacterized protein (TIGR00369 family)
MPAPETRDFGHSPVHGWLGMELVSRSATACEIRLPVRPEFLQQEGALQGGILSSLADASAVYVLLPDLPPERSLTSVEFKLNFLSPGRPDGGDLTGHGKLIRRGRKLAVCEAEVHQGTRVLARGLFTYLFVPA